MDQPLRMLRLSSSYGPLIERHAGDVSLVVPDQLDAQVVMFRLGWKTRIKILLTGMVSVWRTK